MPSKTEFYRQMAEQVSTQLVGSWKEWTAFLTTAARLYKYPFHEQLLIYAQRPDATACAEYDLWNEKMGRYVRRGSKGIALVDDSGDKISIQESGLGAYLVDELMQAARRRFYKPEYVACPGCGRTMYDLQKAFEEVKARTSHLKNTVIAVMGCIVNGPGEMADADWGYVGEGNHKVTIYKGKTPVLKHIQDTEAVDRLVELIEKDQ